VKAEAPKELLALVPEYISGSSTDQGVEGSRGARLLLPGSDSFGDTLTKKKGNTLCIGFQNINKLKVDLIRRGITTNMVWRLCPE
jgi:hypothetical protein